MRSVVRELCPGYGKFLLDCAAWIDWRMWDGGNQWGWWVSYLSFFRHVARLNLPVYEKFQHYEAAAIHGGPRVMHAEYCIISDRPEILTVDEENRPHNESGPFCQWRDGTRLYAWHGTRVPEWIIEHPERIEPRHITEERNAEVRRVLVARYGADRYIQAVGAKVLDASDYGTLYRAEMEDDEPLVMVKVTNSTPEPDGSYKDYWLRVPPEIGRAREAVAWTFDVSEDQYEPEMQT